MILCGIWQMTFLLCSISKNTTYQVFYFFRYIKLLTLHFNKIVDKTTQNYRFRAVFRKQNWYQNHSLFLQNTDRDQTEFLKVKNATAPVTTRLITGQLNS